MKDFTFIFNIEPYTLNYRLRGHNNIEKDSEKMCLIMIESLRAISNECKIIGMSANGKQPSKEFLDKISKFDVSYFDNVVDEKPFNGYFNKINAYNFLISEVTTPYVCFLDVDVLFLRTIDLKNITKKLDEVDLISHLGFEPNPSLANIHKRRFASLEQKNLMSEYKITVDNLFPTGVIFAKNNLKTENILNEWKRMAFEITSDERVLNSYRPEAFSENSLTDEDILSSILDSLKTEIIGDNTFIHYHTFYSLVVCFKDMKIPKQVYSILKGNEYLYLDELGE